MAKQMHALETTAGWKKLQAMMAHGAPSKSLGKAGLTGTGLIHQR
jgi:hypothetical protein